MNKVIGIGEYAISDDVKVAIKTFALSTCVALTVYSPVKKVLGMVHIVLPSSEIRVNKKGTGPAYYADTATPMLVNRICYRYGCKEEELRLMLFGGALSVQGNDIYNIGSRNIEAVNSILKGMNLKVCYSDTGGYKSRSITADVATGTVKVKYRPMTI